MTQRSACMHDGMHVHCAIFTCSHRCIWMNAMVMHLDACISLGMLQASLWCIYLKPDAPVAVHGVDTSCCIKGRAQLHGCTPTHGIAGDADCQNTAQAYTHVVVSMMASPIYLFGCAFDHHFFLHRLDCPIFLLSFILSSTHKHMSSPWVR